jgi:predicted dehydrogenase
MGNMNNGRTVRTGLIGAGWMGCHHAHNIVRNPYAELVAVADQCPEKVQAFLDAEGIQARLYHDYQELLAQDDVDAVVIASPNAMHAEQAVAAAQAGKHIYIEKPMAITLDDCRRVANAVQEAGVKCDVGYHRRLSPLTQYAEGLQGEGKLGDVVFAESDYFHYIPGDLDIWSWLGKEEIAGSLIHAGLGHNVDLLRYFCGEVEQVSCFKDIRMPRKVQVETEDVAAIQVRFESGAIGSLGLFVGPIIPFTFTLRLFGTRGTVDNNRVWLDTIPQFAEPGHENDFITLPKSWIWDNVQGGVSETWNKCMDTFIDDVRLDREPFNDADSGFNTAAVCFAAVQSAVEGSIVRPERLG